ncbi:hypothetical protein D5078_09045 [Pectobacterium carotovorum]|nr:hypothetical protein D5078_09045 [Pectobacterium carotovorum]
MCWPHSLILAQNYLPSSCFRTSARYIPVILQVACALAAFKSAPGRFVTRITYLSKLIGIHSLAARII